MFAKACNIATGPLAARHLPLMIIYDGFLDTTCGSRSGEGRTNNAHGVAVANRAVHLERSDLSVPHGLGLVD